MRTKGLKATHATAVLSSPLFQLLTFTHTSVTIIFIKKRYSHLLHHVVEFTSITQNKTLALYSNNKLRDLVDRKLLSTSPIFIP